MEKELQTRIHKAASAILGVTLFRNNTAMGWAGRVIRSYTNGAKEIADARPLHAGLCVGSSDLIGFKSVVITPEMVGQTVAVFAAVEVKTLTGEERVAQEKFVNWVRKSGGIAGFVRSERQAEVLLS